MDWTQAHHERGSEIYGVTRAYEYVQGRMGQFQTVVTAVISNREMIDGLEVVVPEPKLEEAERASLEATMKESYEQMEAVQQRIMELLHHLVHRLGYKKRTEVAVEVVRQIEAAGAVSAGALCV